MFCGKSNCFKKAKGNIFNMKNKKKLLTVNECLKVIDYLNTLGFALDDAENDSLQGLLHCNKKMEGSSFVDKFVNYREHRKWNKSVQVTVNEIMNKLYRHYYVEMLTNGIRPLSPAELLTPDDQIANYVKAKDNAQVTLDIEDDEQIK